MQNEDHLPNISKNQTIHLRQGNSKLEICRPIVIPRHTYPLLIHTPGLQVLLSENYRYRANPNQERKRGRATFIIDNSDRSIIHHRRSRINRTVIS